MLMIVSRRFLESTAVICRLKEIAGRMDEKGLDMLVQNAINGLNVMPPRGGNPTLTDEQIQAAVEHMVQ